MIEDHFNTRKLQDSIYLAKSKDFDEESKEESEESAEPQPQPRRSTQQKSSSAEKTAKNKNALKQNVAGAEDRKRPKTVFGNRSRDKLKEKMEPKPVLTAEEKKQRWIKSLPPQIRHLCHLECIKDPLMTDKQKVDWYKKYNIESKEKDWVFPKTDQEKAFALELIIDHLYNN